MSTIVYVTEASVTDLSDSIGAAVASASSTFDGMMEAQEDLGQITWEVVTWNIAIGRYVTSEQGMPVDGPKGRVAVFDLDTANGLEVIHTTNWVNGHGEFPAITT